MTTPVQQLRADLALIKQRLPYCVVTSEPGKPFQWKGYLTGPPCSPFEGQKLGFRVVIKSVLFSSFLFVLSSFLFPLSSFFLLSSSSCPLSLIIFSFFFSLFYSSLLFASSLLFSSLLLPSFFFFSCSPSLVPTFR